MISQARIPRSRGVICGVALILLGLWGGLAPFVGPYFHFGFTPDKTWDYNSGRLYYSIVPGAAALLGGLLVLATRNRAVGIVGGLLAAAGGAWFGLGEGFVNFVLKRPSITVGDPLVPTSPSGLVGYPIREYLETLTFFTGLGFLILFFGALAVGRFSMVAAKDVGYDTSADESYYTSLPAVTQPTASQYGTAAGQFPSATDQYTSAGEFPRSAPFPDTPSQFPEAAPFSGTPAQFPETTTAQFPPSEDAD